MRFAWPQILWFFWVLPLLVVMLVLWRRQARRRLARFADERLVGRLAGSVDSAARIWRSALRVSALALLVLAAARPQWGVGEVEVEQEGIDVVIALDISRSMLAEDVAPSRLARAKAELAGLIDSFDGDRVGLVFFAGAAFTQCPLTVDYAAARLFLSQADPSMISAQGTSLAIATRTALDLFDDESGRSRVILAVTDGEDFEGGLDEVRQSLTDRNVALYAVGIGTSEGAPIPLEDDYGRRQGFVRDREGQVVISRLEEAELISIVQASGGVYARAGRGGLDVDRLRREIAALEGSAYRSQRVTSYQDRFVYPLSAALVFVVAECFVRDRRREVRA
jgi:Ca-activated chloride channel family protein